MHFDLISFVLGGVLFGLTGLSVGANNAKQVKADEAAVKADAKAVEAKVEAPK